MRPHEIAERIVAAGSAIGAGHTMALVTSTASVNTRWARSALTTNGHVERIEVAVIAVHDGPAGPQVAAISRPADGLDPTELASAALAQARRSTPAWDAMPLPDASDAPPGPWSAPAGQLGTDDLRDALQRLGEEIAVDTADGAEHFGYLEHSVASHWLATSGGLALRYDQPEARLEMNLKSHQRTRSTWNGFSGSDLAAADIGGMAARARTQLSWQARTLEVPPGRRTAILSPSAVADLMIDLLHGADARAAVEGRSAFSRPDGGTRLGEALSTRGLRLYSDPAMPGQRGAPFLLTSMSHDAASVFDNGLALRSDDWIADGRLQALVSSRAVAARSGLPLALAPDNLCLDAAGCGDLDDLVARTADGLLVTCTWYNRMVDPQTHLITGLTRDGVYVVRDGEVVGRAGNYRFNDSPVSLLGRITDASAPVPALGREMADYFTRTTMPAIVVDGFNLSSASEAV